MIIHKWESVASPIGAVQVIHGMAEHARRYARFASTLNECGYIVWAHDQRGHGLNPTPPVGLGHFADDNGWRLLIDDAASISDRMHSAYPGLPLFVFAHSMGSFVAQSLMAERGDAYRGVVLSGSDGPRGVSEAVIRLIARIQRLFLDPARRASGLTHWCSAHTTASSGQIAHALTGCHAIPAKSISTSLIVSAVFRSQRNPGSISSSEKQNS